MRYINISNNSPLEVKYSWSFLLDNEQPLGLKLPPTASNAHETKDKENESCDNQSQLQRNEDFEKVDVIITSLQEQKETINLVCF